MKPRRLIQVLETLLSQRWPAFIWGPPGIGKSAIVRSVASSAGMPVADLRASLLDPTDLRGIPAIVDGRAIWCPPDFLPKPQDRPGVLFLDEINAAPPLVQASLYQLVLDRRVGEYVLPEGWWIVAAGNRQQDRAVTFRMSSALANRFVHISLEANIDDWRDWAIGAGVDPIVVSFLGFRPALLLEEPGATPAYATPRSWEMLSDVLKRFGDPSNCSDLLPGIVGDGPSREFLGFVKSAASRSMLDAILADPAGAVLPQSLDRLYVVTSWLAHGAAREEIAAAASILLRRLPAEFAVILARDMLRARPAFARDPNYREFMKDNAALISG
jgi:hypothetical protein